MLIEPIIGAVCDLAAGFMHAVGFVMNRQYVVARKTSAVRLLVISHCLMGLIGAVTLALTWPANMPPLSEYGLDLACAVSPYMVAQAFLFLALGRAEASRLSPLLGLKIVAVAVIYVIGFDNDLTTLHWIAVILATVAAFALNYSGGSLPVAVIGAMLVTISCFSFSDVYVGRLIEDVSVLGKYRGPMVATQLYYILAGLMSAAALPWLGSRRWLDWRAAMPYAALWFVSITVMFLGFALAGIVLGNIALATRGLWSIVIGVMIARLGHHHLEQSVPRSVIVRRSVAAAAMMLAIGLFVWV